MIPVRVGPTIDGSRFLCFSAAEPLVAATPFLLWKTVAGAAAAGPEVELAEWQLLEAFGLKARCGPALPDMNAFRARNLLTLQLVAAFWSRYLSELVNSGLLASPLSHRKALHHCIAALLPVNPANLHVLAADWAAEESFDTPAVAAIPAAPARGSRSGSQGGAPAVPARPSAPAILGPAELKFIAYANLILLESADGARPWAALTRGAGMLGGASTRAIRLDGTSALRRVAAPLRAALARHLGVDPVPAYDATLAGALHDFLRDVVLVDGLEAHGVSGAELMAEAMDSFRAQRSMDSRIAVEESRFHLLQHDAPRLHSMIIATSPSNSSAYAAAHRLLALIQGSGTANELICRYLPAIEEGLRIRNDVAHANCCEQARCHRSIGRAST